MLQQNLPYAKTTISGTHPLTYAHSECTKQSHVYDLGYHKYEERHNEMERAQPVEY